MGIESRYFARYLDSVLRTPFHHEHNAGCILLAKELKAAMPEYKTEVALNGWPQDTSIFDGADCIIMTEFVSYGCKR